MDLNTTWSRRTRSLTLGEEQQGEEEEEGGESLKRNLELGLISYFAFDDSNNSKINFTSLIMLRMCSIGVSGV